MHLHLFPNKRIVNKGENAERVLNMHMSNGANLTNFSIKHKHKNVKTDAEKTESKDSDKK